MKVTLIVSLLLVAAFSEVIPFNNDAIEKVFKETADALFLFVGDEEAEVSALEAFKEYDTTSPGFHLILSSKNDGHGLYERLAEYLGVDISETPKVLFLSSKGAKYRFDAEEVSAANLKSFHERIGSGEVKPFLKSAAIPETNDEPVKIIVGKTWKEMVLDSDK